MARAGLARLPDSLGRQVMDTTSTAQHKRATPRALRFGAPIAALVGVVGLVAWTVSKGQAPVDTRALTHQIAVEAPVHAAKAAFDRRDALYIVATVRWGATGGPADERPGGRGAPQVWDGYASLDCGSVVDSDGLGLELQRSSDGRSNDGDRLGPVVVGDSDDQRIYWRSATQGDWDGVRLHVAACKPGKAHPLGASLRIVTPLKTWIARLDANVERFLTVPVASGQFIEVHLAAVKDAEALQRARVSVAPPAPDKGSPVADQREAAPADAPPSL